MRRLVAAVFASLVLAQLPATAASRPATPSPLMRFFQYSRPAKHDSLRLAVQVPMRDGVHLGCYLYAPAVKGGATPAKGRFPGIIENFTPYYLAYPFDVFRGSYYAKHGFQALECTPRGTGTSEGTFQGWLSELENRDNYDLIEWLANQPNSTRKIGQEGNSYGGMTGYRVASLHPPSLVAIAPQQAYASLYREYTYPGGIRSLGDPYWYGSTAAFGVGRPALSTQEAAWLQHPLRDAYWQQIDIDTKWSQIDIPVLGFGGWPDLFQDGMARNYEGLKGPNTYLIQGPWTHSNTFDATVTWGALLAWFDHWLYEDPRAPLPPTHVASYRMRDGPWEALPDWPDPRGHPEDLALTTAGAISPRSGARGERSYVINPGAGAADMPSQDRVVFSGAALTNAKVIAGAPVLRLVATLTDPSGTVGATDDEVDSSQMVDTNFVAHLYDIAASGERVLITRGYLKASHYRSHTYPTRIPLGSPVNYDVELWHIHHRVAGGHHLELVLQTGEQECCLSAAPALAQPLLPLTVSVRTGAGGSRLTMPVGGGR